MINPILLKQITIPDNKEGHVGFKVIFATDIQLQNIHACKQSALLNDTKNNANVIINQSRQRNQLTLEE